MQKKYFNDQTYPFIRFHLHFLCTVEVAKSYHFQNRTDHNNRMTAKIKRQLNEFNLEIVINELSIV